MPNDDFVYLSMLPVPRLSDVDDWAALVDSVGLPYDWEDLPMRPYVPTEADGFGSDHRFEDVKLDASAIDHGVGPATFWRNTAPIRQASATWAAWPFAYNTSWLGPRTESDEASGDTLGQTLTVTNTTDEREIEFATNGKMIGALAGTTQTDHSVKNTIGLRALRKLEHDQKIAILGQHYTGYFTDATSAQVNTTGNSLTMTYSYAPKGYDVSANADLWLSHVNAMEFDEKTPSTVTGVTGLGIKAAADFDFLKHNSIGFEATYGRYFGGAPKSWMNTGGVSLNYTRTVPMGKYYDLMFGVTGGVDREDGRVGAGPRFLNVHPSAGFSIGLRLK